jgi:hypothetical protein
MRMGFSSCSETALVNRNPRPNVSITAVSTRLKTLSKTTTKADVSSVRSAGSVM